MASAQLSRRRPLFQRRTGRAETPQVFGDVLAHGQERIAIALGGGQEIVDMALAQARRGERHRRRTSGAEDTLHHQRRVGQRLEAPPRDIDQARQGLAAHARDQPGHLLHVAAGDPILLNDVQGIGALLHMDAGERPPRAPDHDRAQLLVRSGPASTASRRAVGGRGHAGHGLSKCRASQRAGRI